jgi:hypothetical protein
VKRLALDRVIQAVSVLFVLALLLLGSPWRLPRSLATGELRDVCAVPLFCDAAQIVFLGLYLLVGLGVLALTLSSLGVVVGALGFLGKSALESWWPW